MLLALWQAADCRPVSPRLFPPVSDRAAWDALPAGDRWLAAGNAASRQVPPLPLHLWLDYAKTGRRAQYEAVYFARRRTLCTLAMAECVSGCGQFLPAIADYCWAICEESAWQLPAHNTYIRDTPQLPMPDLARPVVDLFAAETGALLATVHALLGRALDQYAPGLRRRLAQEVDKRVLRPYLTRHFWWMGNGEEPMCNWTAWCTQNVLIAALLLKPARSLPPYLRQAAYSLDCFLKDYGEDGCCNEGAQYYRHAGLTFYNALDLLCRAAPGVFDSAWSAPKVKNMAEYIVHMHVSGPYYFNFADCSPLAGRRGVREYLFGQRVGSAPLMDLAAADRAAALQGEDPDLIRCPDASEGINLYYHVQAAFAEPSILAHTPVSSRAGDAWFASTGLRVVRRGVYNLGIKAGCNADSHNHNDVGSITLYKQGQPLLIDVGVETYSKKTFSPQRYEIWTMQSSWHNLPEFEGAQQQPGPDFAARDVTPLPDGLAMDIAPAYGAVPGLGRYMRTVRLAEDGLRLTDESDYPRPILLSLMSVEKPCLEGGLLRFGALAAAALEGAADVLIEPVPIRDKRLRQAWPDTLYRVRIRFCGTLKFHLQ